MMCSIQNDADLSNTIDLYERKICLSACLLEYFSALYWVVLMGCVETNCRYAIVGKGYQEQTQENIYDSTCPHKLLYFFLNNFIVCSKCNTIIICFGNPFNAQK